MTPATAMPLDKPLTGPRIQTERVPVTVLLTSGIELRGNAHIKPAGYQNRVVDVLNHTATDFMPVTEVTLTAPDGAVTHADTVIVHRAQIELVVIDPTD